MDDQKYAGSTRDDIDLLALLERGISFFSRYKWLFIIATVTGLLLGFLRYSTLPAIYESRLVLQSTLLTNQNNIQVITNWNNSIRNREHETLARLLNCPPSLLKKVKKLEANEIQKIFTPQNPNGFTVDAKVTDPAVFDGLQKAIIYGLDNNGVVKERLAAARKRLTELMNLTAREIQSLDSVKQKLTNILDGKKNSSPLIVDASSISRQVIDLNEKYLRYKEDLLFNSSVQVVQGFDDSTKPTGNNLLVWLILGAVPCLAIAYVIALLHSISQKLKMRAHTLKKAG